MGRREGRGWMGGGRVKMGDGCRHPVRVGCALFWLVPMVETMGFVPSPLQGPKPRASDHVPFRDLEFRGRRPGVERGAGVKGWRELGRVRYALRWIDGGAARKGLSEDDWEGESGRQVGDGGGWGKGGERGGTADASQRRRYAERRFGGAVRGGSIFVDWGGALSHGDWRDGLAAGRRREMLWLS